ncbi:MAG: flagellar biosynthetic protein FliR [Pseudomonadota bacterium]
MSQIFTATAESVWVAAGVFTRVAGALFFVPGFGERGVPMRVKLAGAVALTWLLAPLIAPLVPQTPQEPIGLFLMLGAEAAAGLLIGFGFRLIIFTLQIAGTIAAQNLTISHMFGVGVAQEPEPTLATFLSYGGIAIALIAGLHVELVAALAGLYGLLPFGAFLSGPELAEWGTARLAQVFSLGLSLALPFVAIGFLYNIMLGALSRAMPQVLITLVGVPLLVGLGIATLWLVLPELFFRWSEVMDAVFLDPLWDTL